jgi:hypothetical protein
VGEPLTGVADVALWRLESVMSLFNSGELETRGAKWYISLQLNGERDEAALEGSRRHASGHRCGAALAAVEVGNSGARAFLHRRLQADFAAEDGQTRLVPALIGARNLSLPHAPGGHCGFASLSRAVRGPATETVGCMP